jgi:hypothetical protein
VHRHAKVAENRRTLPFHFGRFHPLFHSLKTFPQSERLVRVTEVAQKLPNRFGLSLRRANNTARGSYFRLPRLNLFEQGTIELPTVLRSIRVNTATAILQRGAWLRETVPLSFETQRNPARHQLRWIIATLQLHIGEDDAVATHAAREAEFLSDRRFLIQ